MNRETTRFPCKFCEKGHLDDAGGSYDRQACEARWCSKRIREIELRLREGPPDDEGPLRRELQRLQRQEERARYVGD